MMDPEPVKFDNKVWDHTQIRELLTEAYALVERGVLEKFSQLSLSHHLPTNGTNAQKAEAIVTRLIGNSGSSALVQLLQIIKQEPSCNLYYQQARERAASLSIEYSRNIDAYLIVVSMDKDQATRLLSGQIIPAEQWFEQFKEAYESDSDQWLIHYGNTVLDWKPHGIKHPFEKAEKAFNSRRPTVSELVKGLERNANEWRRRQGFPELRLRQPIGLNFKDEELVEDLEDEICGKHPYILIVDSISLFHPDIGPRLRESSIMKPNPGNAVLIVTPINSVFLELNRILMDKLKLWHLLQQYTLHLDPFCEFGIKSWWDIRRWSYMALTFSGQHGRFIGNDWKTSIHALLGIQQTSVGHFVTGG